MNFRFSKKIQMWEYLFICTPFSEPFDIAPLGRQGWELVSVVLADQTNMFFKRPL